MNRNIILFIEPAAKPFDTPEKIGNSYINRFTIDEDAAFELSGVYYLKQPKVVYKNKMSTQWKSSVSTTKYEYDKKVIQSALEKANDKKKLHLIVACDYYYRAINFDRAVYHWMREFHVKSLLITKLKLTR